MNRPTIILLMFFVISNAWADTNIAKAGESIYRKGLLPSGDSLQAKRDAESPINAQDAACINCHRRSGLGSTEGQIHIPPITGKYLFPQSQDSTKQPVASRQIINPLGKKYTDATVTKAIREGIGADGRTLSKLMPRYKLDDASMASLIAYLKTISVDSVPGVSDDTLHFATIITPDADPLKRKAMLDVLQRFFATKSNLIGGESRPMQTSRQINYRVARKWQLHVWELTGTAESWERQLQTKLAVEPVFAIISGLGGTNWEPIHQFCEKQSIPCLLPNTDIPVVAEQDFYSIYFSQGVLLEARMLAKRLRETSSRQGLHRIIQIFRQSDIGEQAEQTLRHELTESGLESVSRSFNPADIQSSLTDALKDVKPEDAVLLWLRPDELKALPAVPPNSQTIYVSGIMGGLENAPLSATWRQFTHMAYPYDLPDFRKIRMNFPLAWLRIQHIPVVDERIQTDTFMACGILAETLDHMQDSFVRDFLVERIESMLGKKPTTGYYPRLGLSTGQRFTSKGGYLVHFAEANGPHLEADGDWIVP